MSKAEKESISGWKSSMPNGRSKILTCVPWGFGRLMQEEMLEKYLRGSPAESSQECQLQSSFQSQWEKYLNSFFCY